MEWYHSLEEKQLNLSKTKYKLVDLIQWFLLAKSSQQLKNKYLKTAS